jgi:acetoin utilization deacetylase AcuC-like enzyme
VRRGLQPTRHFESAESKRRLHNLLDVTGALDAVTRVRARPASRDELARVHDAAYIDRIEALSNDASKGCHHAGDCLSLSPGGYDIAALAAGAAIELVDAVLGAQPAGGAGGGARGGGFWGGRRGGTDGGAAAPPAFGAYGLVRPPGHHAKRDEGMG